MILNAKPARRVVRPGRLVLLALALLVLPLSLRGLWAEPPAASNDPGPPTNEKAVADPGPKEAAPEADRPQFPSRLDLEHELADAVRQATMKLELTKTGYNRQLAAERQLLAVKKAYDTGTVTLDGLLEAQRRLAEAEMSRVRTQCDLCTDPKRKEFLLGATSLHISNEALKQAQQTWKQVHVRFGEAPGEARDEAQAREQFFQFKTQTQILLKELQEMESQLR